MRSIFLFLFSISTSFLFAQQNITVDCTAGPISTTFCYMTGDDNSFVITSNDGSALNLSIDEGQVESFWDEFIVLDSDGSELYNGYGNSGDVSGLTFQSLGDSLTVLVDEDISISCSENGFIPITFTAACATCINPTVDYELISDCLNGPQFFMDVTASDFGSASGLVVSDNQGNSSITTSTETVQLGPYPNNTIVEITTNSLIANYFQFAAVAGNGTNWPSGASQLYKDDYPNLTNDEFIQLGLDLMYQNSNILAFVAVYENNDQQIINRLNAKGSLETAYDKPWTETGQQVYVFTEFLDEAYSYIQTDPIIYENYYDPNCELNSGPFTQDYCAITLVDCSAGPVSSSYCYPNNDTTQFEYVSSDGSPLNLTIDAGTVENNWDELIILDSDGITELYNGYGDGGDITGLTFQSSEDTIFFSVASDGSISCESGSASLIDGINYTVACATCVNPSAEYSVIDDCANGEQFLIDVNITDLGSASSVSISDNQGSAGIHVTQTGVTQMGPYPFQTEIIITVSNDEDVNCVINSSPIQLFACPPENDNCDGAIEAAVNADLTCNIVTNGTITSASPSGNESDCISDMDDDVWFTFSATSNAQLISITDIVGSTTNLGHGLYAGSGNDVCSTLEELYCVNNTSSIAEDLTIGTTYHIRIFSVGDDPQNVDFNLCISNLPENTTCDNATNFCGEGGALYGANIFGYPSLGSIGCLYSTPNPSWNTIQIGDSGDINIQITQNTSFDDNGNPNGNFLDVDFVLWGPFGQGDDFCADGVLDQGCPEPGFDCPNNTTNPNFYPYGNIVDCSYDAASIENLTIENAQSGEVYVLLVTNYSNQQGTIQIEQTNSGQAGAGSTVAEISVELGNDQTFCGFPEYEIIAEAPLGDYFEWYQDGVIIPDESGTNLIVTSTAEYSVIVYDEQCGSFAEDSVQVNLYTQSEAFTADNIITCDDSSDDGIEDFDLSIQNDAILGTQDPTQFTISYHESESDAQQGLNSLDTNYTNINNPQEIFARVEHNDAIGSNSGCYSISSFNIEVLGAIPAPVSPIEYVICNPSNIGTSEIFDLSSQDEVILENQNIENFEVTYHISEEDALSGNNPLEELYENVSNPQTIYVRVENTDAYECYAITNFDLVICQIPQGISPNNDGFNDSFELRGYNVKSLKIYNRYGKLVYSTVNYNDSWQGESNEGGKLPVGTYFFHMVYDDDMEKTGWVYINY